MADPSRPPTFSQYKVQPVCGGCGRRLVASKEPAMWFRNLPPAAAVFGVCCWQSASLLPKEKAA